MSEFHLYDTTNSIDHELVEGQTSVGRSAECGIRILSSSVSRKHGMLECTPGRLSYSDLSSSNGSFLNGVRITALVNLASGDTLGLGEFNFTVTQEGRASGAPAGDEEATQLLGASAATPTPVAAPAPAPKEVPSVWSEGQGLESASGTQFFGAESAASALADYRSGLIPVPPLGNAARLVGLSGAIRGLIFELANGATAHSWKVGRQNEAVDLVIPEDSVSGQHAQIANAGGRWKIVNWMSTNGTFVNGQKTLSAYLKHGDTIRMGNAELVFELPATAAPRTSSGSGDGAKRHGWLSRLFRR